MFSRKAQQEMMGFVLIVLLVIVGMLVFMVYSLSNSTDESEGVEASNMLAVIMAQTTDCNAHSEVRADDLEQLFKSCYNGDKCSDSGRDACDVLNETLVEVFDDVMGSESTISAYQVTFSEIDESGTSGILNIVEGNCTGSVTGAQQTLVSSSQNLAVSLRICKG